MSPSIETLMYAGVMPLSHNRTQFRSSWLAEDNDLAVGKCSLSVLTVLQVCLRALILVLHCYKLHLHLCWAQMTMVSTPYTDDHLLRLSGSLRTIWEVQSGSWHARSTHPSGTLFLMIALGISLGWGSTSGPTLQLYHAVGPMTFMVKSEDKQNNPSMVVEAIGLLSI